jgi:hypothetical protein
VISCITRYTYSYSNWSLDCDQANCITCYTYGYSNWSLHCDQVNWLEGQARSR